MVRERRRGATIQSISIADARVHVAKAQQYLRAAEAAAKIGDHHAAGGNAVLAVINAADALSGLLQGTRWSGPHDHAAAHVEKAGPEGRRIASQVRRVVRYKTRYHYDSVEPKASDTNPLITAARRAVDLAGAVANRLPT